MINSMIRCITYDNLILDIVIIFIAQTSRFKMPCLKASSNSNSKSNVSIKDSKDKRAPPSPWNLQFICDPLSSSIIDSESKPPIVDNAKTSGNTNNETVEEEDDQDEEDEEETDMITALRNARARAVAKAAKELAIADGTYVRKPKVPQGTSSDAAASVQEVEVPYSYWTSSQVIKDKEKEKEKEKEKGKGGWTGLGGGTGAGGLQSPTRQDLQRLLRGLEAQSFINEGDR